MAAFSEIRSLKEERKVLSSIASEFNEQLQRLKIEELALVNMVKLQEAETKREANPKKAQADIEYEVKTEEELEPLDLAVSNATKGMLGEEIEEEEEDDSEEDGEHDELTMFLQDLEKRPNTK